MSHRDMADYKRKQRAAATHGGRKADHTSPLRKVLAVTEVPSSINAGVLLQREVLECGHLVRIKEDRHGATIAYRRRCKYCAQGKAPDVDPTEYEEA